MTAKDFRTLVLAAALLAGWLLVLQGLSKVVGPRLSSPPSECYVSDEHGRICLGD